MHKTIYNIIIVVINLTLLIAPNVLSSFLLGSIPLSIKVRPVPSNTPVLLYIKDPSIVTLWDKIQNYSDFSK